MKKRILSMLLIVSAAFVLVAALGVSAFATQTQTMEVSDKDSFWTAFENANDGDVISVTQNINIGNHNAKIMKDNCLVTINLNGHTLSTGDGGDNFGIGNNSALLLQNGTISHLDTLGSSNGIIILNGVTVSNRAWLGSTTAWIVNNSKVYGLRTESGCVNPGASDLHPLGSWWPGQYGTADYVYENPAPAMVGSGVTWKCLATLQDDFNQAKQPGYNRVIMLRDYTLAADATLEASGVNFNLGGYTLTTGEHTLSLAHSGDANIVCNGTIAGDLSMDSNAGAVTLRNLDISGTVSNGAHPTTISGGHYNTIASGSAEIGITDGFFAGSASDYTTADAGYEISGGYFVSRPDSSNIKEDFEVIDVSKVERSITYLYAVQHKHGWGNYSVSGATFTASCTTLEECDAVSTLVLQAPANLQYDGGEKAATISSTVLGAKTGISADDIKYYVKGESTEMLGKPTAAGDYVAKLTIEGVGTAVREFGIYQKYVSLTVGSTTTWYDTITAACNAAETNVATVKIYQDMQESSGDVQIKSGQKITVDLNGFSIRATNNAFNVNSGGELTLDDTSIAETGKIIGDDCARGLDVHGKFTMNGGTITIANTWSGGGLIINGGTVIMNGGSIKDCASGTGGGVYIGSGTFTMNDGEITGCTANNGAGVYVNSGTFTMNDGEISGCNASQQGGGVYVNGSSSTFNFKGGTIEGNNAGNAGGGVKVDNSATFNMSADNLESVSVIQNNTASGNGNGVQMDNGGKFNMSAGTISGNKNNGTTNQWDTAVLVYNGAFTMIGGTISGNQSPYGGVYVLNQGSMTVGGTAKITGNTTDGTTPCNLFLANGKTVSASIANPLTTGSEIGVTLCTADGTGAVTGANSADYHTYFVADNTDLASCNDKTSDTNQIVKLKTKVTLSGISATAITYGQTLADSTVSGTAKFGQTDIAGTWSWKTVSTTKPAVSDSETTEYDVTFTPTSGNYQTTDGKVKIKVSKKQLIVAGTTVANKTYDGTADAKSLVTVGTVEGIVPGANVSVSVASASFEDKNVGEIKDVNITYELSGADAGNYEFVSASETLNADITPAAVVVTAENKSMKLGDALPELTAKVEGLVGSDTVDYTFNKIDVANAGVYSIVPAGDAVQGNYAVSYVSGKLTVSAAEDPQPAPVTPVTPVPDTGDNTPFAIVALVCAFASASALFSRRRRT